MTVSDLGLPPAAVRAGPVRVGRWVWRNLFATIPNTLITLLLLWLLASTVPGVVRWLFVDALWAPATAEQCLRGAGACWAFLQAKYRLILFGPYPYDEQWRPALAMLLFFAMVVATCFPELFRLAGRMRRLLVAWVATVGAITWLLHGGLGLSLVEVRLWGGLPLTLILSVVGAFCAFWLAIFLALGRRSHMPVVRALAIGYIELIRGVPLIGLLFMAVVLFPLIVPPGVDVDKLARAQIAFILFFAAYMAEAIRGGLQAIPAGQYEAAGALGLGYWPTMRFVVLPQALRIVIPTLVNIFIGAFKDTSLVLIIAMFDLLGSANAAKSDSTWWGLYVEAYLFVASIYLVFCALMSAYSQRLERRLGAGRGRNLSQAIDRETMQEAAYRQIRAVLMSGGLAAGEKVTIRGLAGELGMSWTPIREAVRRLAAEGALEVSPNRWIRVPNLSAEQLRELKTIRLMLEGHAAARAAEGASAAFVAEQWRLEADIVAWRGRDDPKGMITRIARWHFAIYAAADMPHLVRMIEGLWLRTAPHTHGLFPVFAAQDRGRHRQVTLKALAKRNGEAARRSMERDIGGALDYLIARAEESAVAARRARGRM